LRVARLRLGLLFFIPTIIAHNGLFGNLTVVKEP
jgi:hypothetical protein